MQAFASRNKLFAHVRSTHVPQTASEVAVSVTHDAVGQLRVCFSAAGRLGIKFYYDSALDFVRIKSIAVDGLAAKGGTSLCSGLVLVRVQGELTLRKPLKVALDMILSTPRPLELTFAAAAAAVSAVSAAEEEEGAPAGEEEAAATTTAVTADLAVVGSFNG